MVRRLEGRVAIVTGSTQGLGEGIAVRLAKAGARLVLNGRSAEKGQRVLARILDLGGEAVFVAADVAIKSDAQRLVAQAAEAFGGVDILVNNAQAQSPYAYTTDPENDAYFDLAL